MLGGLEISRDGKRLTLPPTAASRSLLSFLILHHNRAYARETLAELFWPERPRERSLRNLSTALWHIRHSIAPEKRIITEAQTIQFDDTSDFWLDVDEFKNNAESASRFASNDDERILLLENCMHLYRGDFLEGIYDDWCLEERYHLEGLYLNILGNLVGLYENKNSLDKALRCTELLLIHDPLREEWACSAVRLHMLLNQRREALRVARHCRAVLQSELKVEPSLSTKTVFNQHLGSAWWMSEEIDREAPHAGTKHSFLELLLEHPPFVGREDEWRYLLNFWEQARSGNGALILVSGEAGIGKTRLVTEVCDYVQQTGGIICCSGCHQFERTLPHAVLTDLLRSLIAPNNYWFTNQIPNNQRMELGRLLPELGESPPHSVSSPNEESQIRLFDTVIEFLIGVAQRQPLLIILEDIHWASETTLAWLHRFVRRLCKSPMLVIATYRREEVYRGSFLDNWLIHLELTKLAKHIELAPLTLSAMESWLSTGEDTLIKQIHHWSDGNPYFALETLRVLFDKGWLQIYDGRIIETNRSGGLPIPTSVKQAISMQLNHLPNVTRKVADAAAVIGFTFDFELLQTVLAQDEDTTLEALDTLLRGYLIREQTNILGQDYAFEHHLVREVILERMHPNRRLRMHQLIAKALTERSSTQPRLSGEIAFHYEAGGEILQALQYYRQAALEAADTFAWHEVEKIQGRILDIIWKLDPTCSQPELQLQRGQALAERAYLYFIQGRLMERDADLYELAHLVEVSANDALRVFYLIHRARYHNMDGQYEDALRITEKGLELAERLHDDHGRCHFLTQAGFAHYFRGEYPAAFNALQSALPLCAELSSLRAETLSILSYTSYLIADYKASLDYRQQALQIHSAQGEKDQEAIDLTDIGIIHTQLNHLTEASDYLHNALNLARKIGSQVAESYAANNLGNLEYLCGRYSDALDYFYQSLNLQRATGSRRGEASALSNIGMTLTAIGDFPNADLFLRNAIAIQEEINYPSGLANCLTHLARVLITAGKYDNALDYLKRAKDISLKIGDLDTLDSALISLSWLFLKQEKFEEARQIAREAFSLANKYHIMKGCIFALVLLGLSYLHLDADNQAYACTNRAVHLLEEQGNIEGAEEAVYLAHYQVLEGLNHKTEAAIALQKFQEWVKRKADAITDPEQHCLYLTNWSELTFHL